VEDGVLVAEALLPGAQRAEVLWKRKYNKLYTQTYQKMLHIFLAASMQGSGAGPVGLNDVIQLAASMQGSGAGPVGLNDVIQLAASMQGSAAPAAPC